MKSLVRICLVAGAVLLLGGISYAVLDAATGGDEQQEAAREGDAKTEKENGENDLKHPLLRAFGDQFDEMEVEHEGIDEARRILEEADPILDEAKREGIEAIRAANQPVKLSRQLEAESRAAARAKRSGTQAPKAVPARSDARTP